MRRSPNRIDLRYSWRRALRRLISGALFDWDRDLTVKTIAYIALFLTIGVASCAAFSVDYDRSQEQELSQ